jgi:hypothetical protein
VFQEDPNFRVKIWNDATYAADRASRRSDIGFGVFMNGGPIVWNQLKLQGVADSSFSAEYCGCSAGTKAAIPITEELRFMGIQPRPTGQYCDSTSAVQIARNPNNLGAARSLGIRLHTIRYAIAHQGLQLRYSITEDMVMDMLTKRLARKKLARFAAIFFNVLGNDWKSNPDDLDLIVNRSLFPELTRPEESDIEEEETDVDSDDETKFEDHNDEDPPGMHSHSDNFVPSVVDDYLNGVINRQNPAPVIHPTLYVQEHDDGPGFYYTHDPIPLCELPGCTIPCWVSPAAKILNYCSMTHANIDLSLGPQPGECRHRSTYTPRITANTARLVQLVARITPEDHLVPDYGRPGLSKISLVSVGGQVPLPDESISTPSSIPVANESSSTAVPIVNIEATPAINTSRVAAATHAMYIQHHNTGPTYHQVNDTIPLCELEGCSRPCWIRPPAQILNYCGRTHAEADGALSATSNAALIDASYIPTSSQMHLPPIRAQNMTNSASFFIGPCALPGCDRPRYIDRDGFVHRCCGQTHARLFNNV